MARLFTSGFELNSITDGVEFTTNTATVQIVTTNPRSGTYHGRVSGSSNGFWRQNVRTSNSSLGTTGYIGVGICVHSAVNASTQLVRWSTTTNGMQSNITLKSDNTLVLLKANGTQVGSASAALNIDQWYYVELKMTSNATIGSTTLEGRLDGAVFATGANSNTSVFARALIGLITGTQTSADVYFDDWKVNDDSGSDQNGYPGSGKVLLAVPGGNGETVQWSIGGSSAAATNWQGVADANDGTSYNSTSTLGREDLYAVGSLGLHSYDTINLVQVGARFANISSADATASFKVEIEKASGGTKAQSAAIIPNSTAWRTNNPSTAGDAYALTAYADPDGGPWTSATLDSMRIGQTLSAANTAAIGVTAVWAYVDYTPGAAPANNPGFLMFM
jgi:hypothetical protein